MKKLILILGLLLSFQAQAQDWHFNGVIVGGGTSDPVGTHEGQLHWDTDDDKFRYYDGTSWNDLGGGSSITLGSANEIPYMNPGATDFIYGAITYNGNTFQVSNTSPYTTVYDSDDFIASYQFPDKFQFSQSGNNLILQRPTLTGTNTQTFQDASGTIALLSDISGGGIGNVVEDTTPELGGILYVNGNPIVSVSDMVFDIDNDNNSTLEEFIWTKDNVSTFLMRLSENGNLILDTSPAQVQNSAGTTALQLSSSAAYLIENTTSSFVSVDTSGDVDITSTSGTGDLFTVNAFDNFGVSTDEMYFNSSAGSLGRHSFSNDAEDTFSWAFTPASGRKPSLVFGEEGWFRYQTSGSTPVSAELGDTSQTSTGYSFAVFGNGVRVFLGDETNLDSYLSYIEGDGAFKYQGTKVQLGDRDGNLNNNYIEIDNSASNYIYLRAAATGTINIGEIGSGNIEVDPSGSQVTLTSLDFTSDGDIFNNNKRLTANVTKAITIEDPTSSEDISLFFSDEAITITQMNSVCVGTTPSVTWTIRHSTDRSAAGNEVVTSGTTTTSTTTGVETTAFNDATIPAGSWVWLETTAASGTIDEINITLTYDAD